MAEYRYYLIPDFMSHVFPQQFEEQAPTEFFSNTADLMKRYKQLREMPYNNEYTWNERTNLPYPRLTVGIDRRDPDGAVTIMQVRNGINYLCDDYQIAIRSLSKTASFGCPDLDYLPPMPGSGFGIFSKTKLLILALRY